MIPDHSGINQSDLCSLGANGYSVFDPSAYRNLAAKWHFPQENATYEEFETSTYGSKAL
jgi:hypothetical protein